MLKSPHILLAHKTWREHLKPGMNVIDATLGNGKDTFEIAKMLSCKGNIYCFDIQKEAIDKANVYLEAYLGKDELSKITFFEKSHICFDPIKAPIDLIIYNLGYLPSGDKSITTMTNSTLKSLDNACKLLSKNGMISLTCYPGHAEGNKEQAAILQYLMTFSSNEYLICHHSWINRRSAPSLIIVQKH